ncbi:MAG: DUF6502 family protein [Burkholderiaceae bacterium]
MGKFPMQNACMDTSSSDPSASQPLEQQIDAHVLAAASRLLLPLARLFVSHGLKFGQAEELLKQAFVRAGELELNSAGSAPNQSRLSVTTGVHRKDVRRLLGQTGEAASRRPSRSVATEVYTRWSTAPEYQGAQGMLELPMRASDGAASFERLAREVSTDAHPRSVLEELRRLGLAELTEEGAGVRLTPGGFVPLLAQSELLDLLAANTGDHLSTAVGNVLGRGPRMLEQSVFDQGLTVEDARAVDLVARRLWAQSMSELVALMESLARERRAADDDANHRVRVGMFCHWEVEQERGT